MFTKLIDGLYNKFSAISFDMLVWIILGAFAGLTVLVAAMCVALPKFRATDKRAFLGLVNAFTAVVFAAFLTESDIGQSALFASLFWCLGYVCYGFICLISRPIKKNNPTPQMRAYIPEKAERREPPQNSEYAAKNSVRLGHAMSVTQRLLEKNLSKSDRQELEKLKQTLEVMSEKKNLTTAESEILNDDFNALLKLMAKYDV